MEVMSFGAWTGLEACRWWRCRNDVVLMSGRLQELVQVMRVSERVSAGLGRGDVEQRKKRPK